MGRAGPAAAGWQENASSTKRRQFGGKPVANTPARRRNVLVP